jgi:serine/threonine protein kinase
MSQVRYQSLGPLMAGEGSRAFLGLALEDGAPPRPVVLIYAPPELVADPDLIERLRRETDRAVVFDHPHILRVHGLVTLEHGLARVTEYADGETLRRVLEVTPRIPPPLAARLVADAAMGVHYAHMAGNDDGTPLVHGDIRPETLMISYQGVCKVTGYGALSVAPKERDGRRVRNRRKYSAPEQLLGGREAVNVKTDVFLLGLTLYECLTGKIPFKDAPDADTATLTKPLPHLPPNVPKGLDEVVQKATAKRANERYPTALALREAIVEALGDLPQQDVLSVFMNRLFPAKDQARASRTQVIELGIEQALRRSEDHWPTAAKAPTATPSRPGPAAPAGASAAKPATPVQPAPAPTAPKTGSSATVPPAPRASAAPTPTPTAAPTPEATPAPAAPAPKRSSGRSVALLGAALVAVISVAAVVVARQDLSRFGIFEDLKDAGTDLTAVAPLPPVDPLAATDAGVFSDAGTVSQAAAMADGGTDGGTDAGVEPALELIVDPRVDIFLGDGGVLGRTPFTVPMPPGRHVLSLVNASLGIQTARTVTVAPTGRTTQRIYLNKGYVTIRAPQGSVIQVDGRKVGTSPVEELDLYEGYHRLLVMVGEARWQKSFQLEANQRVTFSVLFEEEPEE